MSPALYVVPSGHVQVPPQPPTRGAFPTTTALLHARAHVTFWRDHGPSKRLHELIVPPSHASEPHESMLSPASYVEPSGHVHVPPQPPTSWLLASFTLAPPHVDSTSIVYSDPPYPVVSGHCLLAGHGLRPGSEPHLDTRQPSQSP